MAGGIGCVVELYLKFIYIKGWYHSECVFPGIHGHASLTGSKEGIGICDPSGRRHAIAQRSKIEGEFWLFGVSGRCTKNKRGLETVWCSQFPYFDRLHMASLRLSVHIEINTYIYIIIVSYFLFM